ncbi:MAG TPA: hypothetical protein VIS29_16185 [Streptomyces sp.]|jgi:hypothetical protein
MATAEQVREVAAWIRKRLPPGGEAEPTGDGGVTVWSGSRYLKYGADAVARLVRE